MKYIISESQISNLVPLELRRRIPQIDSTIDYLLDVDFGDVTYKVWGDFLYLVLDKIILDNFSYDDVSNFNFSVLNQIYSALKYRYEKTIYKFWENHSEGHLM